MVNGPTTPIPVKAKPSSTDPVIPPVTMGKSIGCGSEQSSGTLLVHALTPVTSPLSRRLPPDGAAGRRHEHRHTDRADDASDRAGLCVGRSLY